jgi:hypothetical protein
VLDAVRDRVGPCSTGKSVGARKLDGLNPGGRGRSMNTNEFIVSVAWPGDPLSSMITSIHRSVKPS